MFCVHVVYLASIKKNHHSPVECARAQQQTGSWTESRNHAPAVTFHGNKMASKVDPPQLAYSAVLGFHAITVERIAFTKIAKKSSSAEHFRIALPLSRCAWLR